MNQGAKVHNGNVGTSEWLTDPELIQSLGEFDLDPCAPVVRPWSTAKHHFTILDDGLSKEWFGRVWMNPPYDRYVIANWLRKMAEYGHGISLIFSRTDTDAFHEWVFNWADSILFIKQRLYFYKVDGTRARANAGAPSVLVAYGDQNSQAIEESGIKGKHMPLGAVSLLVVGFDASWRVLVKTALIKLKEPASISKITEVVESMAPEKVSRNGNYKAKIRQVLREHFDKVERGVYSNLNFV